MKVAFTGLVAMMMMAGASQAYSLTEEPTSYGKKYTVTCKGGRVVTVQYRNGRYFFNNVAFSRISHALSQAKCR